MVEELPKTDTRFRPDQRLYENGQVEEAEAEKLRLEQKQRENRRAMELEQKPWTPRFFEQVKSEDSESGLEWVYNGEYWKNRGKFAQINDIFA